MIGVGRDKPGHGPAGVAVLQPERNPLQRNSAGQHGRKFSESLDWPAA
jgi:hypothetical protein